MSETSSKHSKGSRNSRNGSMRSRRSLKSLKETGSQKSVKSRNSKNSLSPLQSAMICSTTYTHGKTNLSSRSKSPKNNKFISPSKIFTNKYRKSKKNMDSSSKKLSKRPNIPRPASPFKVDNTPEKVFKPSVINLEDILPTLDIGLSPH